MKNQLPLLLIFARLAIGFIIIILSWMQVRNYALISITLLSIGLLTDIFDGIIARQLNVSTQKLRRLDSSVDQVFFISVAIATFIQHPAFFTNHWVALIVLISIETLTYVVSLLKFKKEIATHSIGAKVWTLLLFASLVQVILKGESGVLFYLCFWVGILTRIEFIAIILSLKSWTNDVPSFYHALQIRKGKAIKRHKMFNG